MSTIGILYNDTQNDSMEYIRKSLSNFHEWCDEVGGEWDVREKGGDQHEHVCRKRGGKVTIVHDKRSDEITVGTVTISDGFDMDLSITSNRHRGKSWGRGSKYFRMDEKFYSAPLGFIEKEDEGELSLKGHLKIYNEEDDKSFTADARMDIEG